MKPYYQEDGITIYHADCRDILPHLPKVDLVLTDPPYGIGMESHNDNLSVSINGINAAKAWKVISFMSPRRIQEFINGCNAWDFRRLLWWNKSADISFPWRGWYMNSEAVCVFDSVGAVWPKHCIYHSDLYQSGPEEKRPQHPCWKPVDVTKDLLQHGSDTGFILDPFMGSGTTLVAAKQLGRKAIGIEINERYCEIAAGRLRQGVLDLS